MYYLIVVDGRPLGMIQTYLVSDHPEWEEVVGPGELAGVDLLTGEEDATGRGLGPQVLEQFTRDVVFRPPGNARVCGDAEEPNRHSWRRSRRPASAMCATSRRKASRTA